MQKTDDRWEVIPRTEYAKNLTPEVDGKKFPWGRQGAFQVKDGGEAEALKQKYNGQLITMKVSSPDVHDRGHKYTFSLPNGVPWGKYDELGRRIPDNLPPAEDADTNDEHKEVSHES